MFFNLRGHYTNIFSIEIISYVSPVIGQRREDISLRPSSLIAENHLHVLGTESGDHILAAEYSRHYEYITISFSHRYCIIHNGEFVKFSAWQKCPYELEFTRTRYVLVGSNFSDCIIGWLRKKFLRICCKSNECNSIFTHIGQSLKRSSPYGVN